VRGGVTLLHFPGTLTIPGTFRQHPVSRSSPAVPVVDSQDFHVLRKTPPWPANFQSAPQVPSVVAFESDLHRETCNPTRQISTQSTLFPSLLALGPQGGVGISIGVVGILSFDFSFIISQKFLLEDTQRNASLTRVLFSIRSTGYIGFTFDPSCSIHPPTHQRPVTLPYHRSSPALSQQAEQQQQQQQPPAHKPERLERETRIPPQKKKRPRVRELRIGDATTFGDFLFSSQTLRSKARHDAHRRRKVGLRSLCEGSSC